jgi:glycosyltransferase involved in cell wall biosynthesis
MPPETTGWQYRIIPFPKLWTQTRLPWDLFFHQPRPDVFFSPSHYAPRWSPVPTVISIMDLGFLQSPEQFTSKDFNQLKNWTAYSANRATKIITISEFTKKDVLTTYHRLPEDVTVTYPGYDPEFYKSTPDVNVLKRLHITKPYVLFLGSLKPSKNVEGLISAFNNLQDKRLKLVIAGKKAWLYDKIFSLVQDLKLSDRIIFTGFVPDADVPALMSLAEVFILPSFYEGFGIPVLEAMSCKTPVVVSRIASLPEVAGPAGVYVNPVKPDSITEGIQKALKNKDKLSKLGLIQAKKFSWDKTAGQTIKVLQSVKM